MGADTLSEGFAFDSTTGPFTFDAAGDVYQPLVEGETLVVSQAWTVTDRIDMSEASIPVTVTGTNNEADIAGLVSGSVTKDGNLQASCAVTIEDVDAGEAALAAEEVAWAYGTVAINAGGEGVNAFIFSASSEAFDPMTDFQHLADHVDLHRIDANTGRDGKQGFDFIGSADFGLSAGQLRFGVPVQGNTNGDDTTAFELGLTGVTVLTATDLFV